MNSYTEALTEYLPEIPRNINSLSHLLKLLEEHPNASNEYLATMNDISMPTFHRNMKLLRQTGLVHPKKNKLTQVLSEGTSKEAYYPPQFYTKPVEGISSVAKWMATLPETERARVLAILGNSLDDKIKLIIPYMVTFIGLMFKADKEFAKRPGEAPARTDSELKAIVEEINSLIR